MQEQPGICCEVNFPEKFVLARRGYSDNIWRFHCVEAKKTHRENNYQVYDIVDSDWRRSMNGADWVLDPERVDTNQYIIYKRNPPRTVPLRLPYYYITGISLVKDRRRYPIIEFTCSNWFPECDKQNMLVIQRKEEFRKILGDINTKQWHLPLPPRIVPTPLPTIMSPTPARPVAVASSRAEIISSRPTPAVRAPTPPISSSRPLQRHRSPTPSYYTSDEDNEEELPLAFRVHSEPAAAPAPVPFPLPKHVGDMLIKSAREGTESCPISAIPYSECKILTVTSCFHIFQKESLATWQKDHNTCPVCRTKIVNVIDGKK